MFPHTVFQVAGHTCVECSLGFVAHDVERGLSYDCAPLWIPAFAGMTGESFAGMTGETCVGGNPWLLCSFSVIILRHSRVGGSVVAILVLRDNTASFPRRRESIEYDSSSDVGWAKRSVPNALETSIPDVCQSTCLNCQAAKSDVPTPAFSGYWSRLCRVFPWLCLP